MATAIENLNLEEGKSEALRAVLAGIAESSAADGGPRYSGKVCCALARIIVCRTYATPVLELCHLITAAAGRDGRYENVFWGVDRASAGAFRRVLVARDGLNPNVRTGARRIHIRNDADGFQIAYGRMPLLAALLEFMIMTVGYPDVDALTSTLRRPSATSEDVLDAARAMQRALYAYLKDHLPTVQRQRREHHFLGYVEAHAGNRTGADAIGDSVVLDYWRAFADSDDVDAKTFRGVYDTARRLISALDAAADRVAGDHARSIGMDIEAGEVDPADVEVVIAALDSDVGPLEQLLESSGEQVKFINVSEAEVLRELPLGDSTARRIPVSVMRNAVYGGVQLRMTTALRRGGRADPDLPSVDSGYYRNKMGAYAELITATENLALAALWPLFEAERPEAVDLALALAPDIDWGLLAQTDGMDDPDNVVSLGRSGALRQFFAVEPHAGGDEIAALIADARRAWRGVNRAGFREKDGDAVLDVMADSVADVLRLIAAVRRILDRDLGPIDWPLYEDQDAATFADTLARLYDLKEEVTRHAG